MQQNVEAPSLVQPMVTTLEGSVEGFVSHAAASHVVAGSASTGRAAAALRIMKYVATTFLLPKASALEILPQTGQEQRSLDDTPEDQWFMFMMVSLVLLILLVGMAVGSWMERRSTRKLVHSVFQLRDEARELREDNTNQSDAINEIVARNVRCSEEKAILRRQLLNTEEELHFHRQMLEDSTKRLKELEEQLRFRDARERELRAMLNNHVFDARATRDSFTWAKALLSRAMDEMIWHQQLCPLRNDVWIATTGRCWHSAEDCPGLERANQTEERRACRMCSHEMITPDVVNSLSSTTFRQDFEQFRTQHNCPGYGNWTIHGD